MNATLAKLTQAIGNAAAYTFWAASALICSGFIVVIFTYDAPIYRLVGQIFAVIAAILILSIVVMATCHKVLQVLSRA